MSRSLQRTLSAVLIAGALVALTTVAVGSRFRNSRRGNDVSKLPNPSQDEIESALRELKTQFEKPLPGLGRCKELFLLGAHHERFREFLQKAPKVRENDIAIGYEFGNGHSDGDAMLVVVVDKASGRIFCSEVMVVHR